MVCIKMFLQNVPQYDTYIDVCFMLFMKYLVSLKTLTS